MTLKLPVLFLSALILSVFLQVSIDSERKPAAPVFEAPEELLLGFLGGLSVTIADILWIRVDEYFHGHEAEEGHAHRHAGEAPATQEGFKRITEVMPFLRVITWLDPHFVRAYQVGGWHLAFNLNKPDEAEKFLKEGLKFNQSRYEIYAELGKFYLEKKGNPLEASLHLSRALEHPVSDAYEKKGLCILLAVSLERQGRLDEALKTWRMAGGIDPADMLIKARIEELEKGKVIP